MSMMRTQEWFETNANIIHSSKYSYEKSLYTGIKNKLIITCIKHGDFQQTPDGHINKSRGCPTCGIDHQVRKRTSSSEEFIKKSKIIHNNLYSYDNVKYKMCKIPVKITCNKHGDFNQIPSSHLSGSGCPKCKSEKLHLIHKKDITHFIAEAKKIHGNLYLYKNSKYKNNNTNIVITCRIHGNFVQTPASHLRGSHCPFCNFTKSSKNKTLSQEQCIEKCVQVHGNKYTYERSKYIDSVTKIIITCPVHGDFPQAPASHWSGSNCPKCACLGPSLSEISIMNILNDNNVDFVFQKRFPDCRNPKTNYMLVFDFYLPKINTLIEYDGLQHYEEITNKPWESLEYIQYKDSVKNKYCSNVGIKLIRISYKQNIIDRLKEENIIPL